MTKSQDIDAIIAERPFDLLLDVLWSDAALVGKMRANLNNVSAANIKHYRKQFVGDKI